MLKSAIGEWWEKTGGQVSRILDEVNVRVVDGHFLSFSNTRGSFGGLVASVALDLRGRFATFELPFW